MKRVVMNDVALTKQINYFFPNKSEEKTRNSVNGQVLSFADKRAQGDSVPLLRQRGQCCGFRAGFAKPTSGSNPVGC